MRMQPDARLSLAALILIAVSAICPVASFAQSASPLARALKQDNAKHLGQPVPASVEKQTPMIEFGFDEEPKPGPFDLKQGQVQVRVVLRDGEKIDDMQGRVPEVTVSVGGKQVAKADGGEAVSDNPSFLVQIAEMDPGNPHPEVVFSTYTGGAHCCSQTRILTSSKDGATWRIIEAGEFDGGPVRAQDIDGDERFELALRDNRFLYAFGCYACSAAPLQILRLDGAGLNDVSREARYRGAQLAWLAEMVGSVEGDIDANGFLAGYVAQKILIGEGAQGWALMLKYYDKNAEDGLDECQGKTDPQGNCHGKTVRRSFPDALRNFLQKSGYEVPR